LDVGFQQSERGHLDTGLDLGGGQRAPGAWGAHGRYVGQAGGRSSDGTPCFDQPVPAGGYLWWYVDALSDCGQFGLTIIAFVGSVFSPYYAWARRGQAPTNPDNFCSLNVALYSRQANRWAMTERNAQDCSRSQDHFNIGPSQVRWDGQAMVIDINEVCVPVPRRIKGTVRLHPQQLFNFGVNLEPQGLHRWGPIAPFAHVEVQLQHPDQSWQGHAYLDSNEGDEPIDRPFKEWDWSRSLMANGDTAVLYDLQLKSGENPVLALRFDQQGRVHDFEPPAVHNLRRTKWAMARRMRSDGPVHVKQQLEDTPFYQRAVLESELLGEAVESFHETLHTGRLVSPVVQAMLPWRMPRRF
jgi:carotenoid 1,2-hydratase